MCSSELALCTIALIKVQGAGTPLQGLLLQPCLGSALGVPLLVSCKESCFAKSANESGPLGLFVSGEISEQQYKQFII